VAGTATSTIESRGDSRGHIRIAASRRIEAEERAARMVNKQRRKAGETKKKKKG
jgi:hypothetical protein